MSHTDWLPSPLESNRDSLGALIHQHGVHVAPEAGRGLMTRRGSADGGSGGEGMLVEMSALLSEATTDAEAALVAYEVRARYRLDSDRLDSDRIRIPRIRRIRNNSNSNEFEVFEFYHPTQLIKLGCPYVNNCELFALVRDQ